MRSMTFFDTISSVAHSMYGEDAADHILEIQLAQTLTFKALADAQEDGPMRNLFLDLAAETAAVPMFNLLLGESP